MGLAAIFVGGLIALAIVVAIIYGAFVGLMRFGRFLWWLLVGPEAQVGAIGSAGEEALRLPCWQEKNCPAQVRETCPAYLQKGNLPCWLATLRDEGRLRVDCLACKRFSVADMMATLSVSR